MNETGERYTIAYVYLFNYFGGDTFKDKVITGAGIDLAIRVYDENGNEIKFPKEKEPRRNGKYLCDIFKISFDREKVFVIDRNVETDNFFRVAFGWNKIEAEVVGYSLDYESGWTEEQLKDMPEIMKIMPVSASMTVTEEEFRTFLMSHADAFDIKDNINAQVPAVTYINTISKNGIK